MSNSKAVFGLADLLLKKGEDFLAAEKTDYFLGSLRCFLGCPNVALDILRDKILTRLKMRLRVSLTRPGTIILG